MSDIAQHMDVSRKVEIDDLDWELARKIGLTQQEIDSLAYFVDVEGQTVYYFLEVAKQKIARAPELLGFLTMWNYEEYFHSHAMIRLLTECGVAHDVSRAAAIRNGARLTLWLEDSFQTMVAKLAPKTFVSLWMFWGALQEVLTARAYEALAHSTSNPVLAELCRRIAKQERRHFAYYFGEARERMAGQKAQQRIIRFLANHFYSPVGRGVKTDAQRAQLVAKLFPGDKLFELMSYIERRMGQLEGMQGLDCCSRWAAKVQPMLPPETRASSVTPLSVAA